MILIIIDVIIRFTNFLKMAENTPQNQIKHTLTQLGMNESDITIYMLGLEIGAATIAQLAQESDM